MFTIYDILDEIVDFDSSFYWFDFDGFYLYKYESILLNIKLWHLSSL